MDKSIAGFDKYILVTVGILLVIGLLMVYSASSAYSREYNGDSLYYLKRQLLCCIIGIVIMLSAMFIPYNFYQKISYVLLILSLVLLVLVFIPKIGVRINGSSRWIKIWFLTFQPVEFAKLALIIYIARFLNQKAEYIQSFKHGILPVILILLIFFCLIFAQPDFGTIILITLITFLMLFIGGVSIRHLLLIGFVAIIFMAIGIIWKGYRLTRVLTFINPWATSEGAGYHTIQSYYALGSGGIFGTGIGAGIQKLHYLPMPHTDSIFAVIGEELGFTGTALVITLFMVLAWRGIRIALNIEDRFAGLLAIGISCLICFQAIINIGVATGSLPYKGITLPFISSGGSSLIICLTSIGILLNISRNRAIVQ